MTSLPRPILPASAPFAPEQIDALNSVMAKTNVEQRQWLSGYLAGFQAANAGPALATAPAAAPSAPIPLTILYLTESGNSEELADNAAKAAKKLGFKPKLLDAADADIADLPKHENLLVIAATWGEGDPPERAVDFYEALMGDGVPRLEGTRFSVLSLGDTAYVNFCEIGKKIDWRLADLGAERAADRVDCDVDFEDPARGWTNSTLETLRDLAEPDAGESDGVIHVDFAGASSAYSKSNPFSAEISQIVNLNSSRSSKETFHVELSLEGSGLAYAPGDAIGIVPKNEPEMVETVIEAAGLSADSALVDRLTTELDITVLTRPVMDAYQILQPNKKLAELLSGDGWRSYIEGRQIIDLLQDFPAKMTVDGLTDTLRKLPPRLYSVASSLEAAPDEAHLLVGMVTYNTHGRERHGVASHFLADLKAGDSVPIYVKSNKNFRLPESGDTPAIMIGPGTGVAPFRGFLQQREAEAARGKNWLLFGDRTYTHDFLYQLDWQGFRKSGVLTDIDLAFSRDTPDKVYVQHRLWEKREQLWAWLEDGAHLYVCGDEKAMAKDVDATLARIVAEVGGREPGDYLSDLKKNRRYQRDVY